MLHNYYVFKPDKKICDLYCSNLNVNRCYALCVVYVRTNVESFKYIRGGHRENNIAAGLVHDTLTSESMLSRRLAIWGVCEPDDPRYQPKREFQGLSETERAAQSTAALCKLMWDHQFRTISKDGAPAVTEPEPEQSSEHRGDKRYMPVTNVAFRGEE